eukprot:1073482-Rhodomonas_salina.2
MSGMRLRVANRHEATHSIECWRRNGARKLCVALERSTVMSMRPCVAHRYEATCSTWASRYV